MIENTSMRAELSGLKLETVNRKISTPKCHDSRDSPSLCREMLSRYTSRIRNTTDRNLKVAQRLIHDEASEASIVRVGFNRNRSKKGAAIDIQRCLIRIAKEFDRGKGSGIKIHPANVKLERTGEL
jgi:hypothetical protein